MTWWVSNLAACYLGVTLGMLLMGYMVWDSMGSLADLLIGSFFWPLIPVFRLIDAARRWRKERRRLRLVAALKAAKEASEGMGS